MRLKLIPELFVAIFFTTKDTKFTKGGKCHYMIVFLCVLRGFIIFGFGTFSLQSWMLISTYRISGFDSLLKFFQCFPQHLANEHLLISDDKFLVGLVARMGRCQLRRIVFESVAHLLVGLDH